MQTIAEKRAYRRAWYQKNKERNKAYIDEWQRKNPDKVKKQQKQYREKNKEKIREHAKAFYWKEENRERILKFKRLRYLKHRTRLLAKLKEKRDGQKEEGYINAARKILEEKKQLKELTAEQIEALKVYEGKPYKDLTEGEKEQIFNILYDSTRQKKQD